MSPVTYWVAAAREQSRMFVRMRLAYQAETHAKRRGQLWFAGNRCRDRIPVFMEQARRVRAELAGVGGAA